MIKRIRSWWLERLTDRDERHGIELSMYIEAAPLNKEELWSKLHAALDLLALHAPTWLRRMRRLRNSVHVRRIPGTRAMLTEGQFTILDPYLLADFSPAQIAASIVHEATHALFHANGIAHDPNAPARQERACRASEVRLGRRLQSAGVSGADQVLERAERALHAPDEEVGVVVDWRRWQENALVTRIDDFEVPLWVKRFIARRRGVLDSDAARARWGK